MLSHLGFWINSTSNNAKILCHFNCSLMASIVFRNTWRRHCPWRPWSYVSPNNVIKFSSNIQQHTIPFVSWPLQLCSTKFFRYPSCTKTPLITISFVLMWTLNGLVKFRNFNTRAGNSFSFKSSNALCCSSFHLKDKSFFRKSKNGFAIYKNLL